jgi:hypothetical protein
MFNSEMPTKAELPTTRQLIKSTILAIMAAAAILVVVVLPSEYAVDPTGVGRVLGLTEMGQIKSQLAKEAEEDKRRDQQGSAAPAATDKPRSNLILRLFEELGIKSAYAQQGRSDEISVTLPPGEGAEVKLTMKKGTKADYSWQSAGGVVNYDLHGDAGGKETSYKKARGVAQDTGVLQAGFDGKHGWFWRNRTDKPVTIVLKTTGAYAEIQRVK